MSIIIHAPASIEWFSDRCESKEAAIARLQRGKMKLQIAMERLDNQIEELRQ